MTEIYHILLNNLFFLGWVAALLIAAYIGYKVLFFLFGHVFRKNPILNQLRLPVLSLFLELSLFVAVDISDFPATWKKGLTHFITILFIATIGWVLIKLTMAFEQNLRQKSEQSVYITRAKIFYRTLIFLISIVTFATILMTFPVIRSLGIGILGSAGIAGIALGIAARPILSNLMAGFQIALTKMLKIGDHVVMEKEHGVVEEIYLTHVILKTSDLRRILFPISYFIDKPFENWDRVSEELVAQVHLYCDYAIPIDKVRLKLHEILLKTPLWNHKTWQLEVTDYTENAIEIRLSMSANNAIDTALLKSHVREEILTFLQKEYPHSFPHQRHL